MESSFYMYKHSLAAPEIILTKSRKYKKNIVSFNLQLKNIKKCKFNKIDDLLILLKRRELKIIKN